MTVISQLCDIYVAIVALFDLTDTFCIGIIGHRKLTSHQPHSEHYPAISINWLVVRFYLIQFKKDRNKLLCKSV